MEQLQKGLSVFNEAFLLVVEINVLEVFFHAY